MLLNPVYGVCASQVNSVDHSKDIIDSNRFEKKGSLNLSIESITNKLVSKFQDEAGRGFYKTVARTHTEYEIDKAIELSFKYGKKPAAYFNSLMRRK